MAIAGLFQVTAPLRSEKSSKSDIELRENITDTLSGGTYKGQLVLP
jgi:hypothetical protein